jgi:hypothetical protein
MSQSLKEVCILLSVNSVEDMPRFSSVFYSVEKLNTEIFFMLIIFMDPLLNNLYMFLSRCLEKMHNVCTET